MTLPKLQDMQKAIETDGDGLYFDLKLANFIAVHWIVNPSDARRMIQIESADEEKALSGRGKEGRAQQIACKRVLGWLLEAHEYSVDLADPLDLARFVASSRTACVWAVLIGKSVTLKWESAS